VSEKEDVALYNVMDSSAISRLAQSIINPTIDNSFPLFLLSDGENQCHC